MNTRDQLSELLSEQVVFSLLDAMQLSTLIDQCEEVSFSMGQDIVLQGEPGDSAWIISAGRARVIYRRPDGQRITLANLTRGALFGEQALLNDQPRNATVRASEDVTAIRIDYQVFRRILDDVPEIRAACVAVLGDNSLQNFLKTSTLLSEVPASQLRNLIGVLQHQSYSEGDVISLTGLDNEGLHIVQDGRFSLRSTNGEILRIVTAGSAAGEAALIGNPTEIGSLVCNDRGHTLFLPKAEFTRFAHTDIELHQSLLDDISARTDIRADTGLTAQLPADEVTDQQASPSPAKRKSFRRHPFVSQLDESDCGAACMAMIGRYYGAKQTMNRLREVLRVDQQGASLYNMARGAEQIGYRSRGIRIDYEQLMALQLPAVAFWKGYHYIVVYEASPTRVVVGDPATGIEKYNRAEFEEHWSGHLLEVTPGEALLNEDAPAGRWARFWPLVKPYRSMLVEIFIASLLLNIFALAMPIFTQTVVDKVLIERNVNLLNIMLIGMILIGLFQVLTSLLRYRLLLHVSTHMRLAMSSQLFGRILRLSMRYFDTRRIGDILTRFGDNEKIQHLLTGTVVTTLLDGLMIFVYVALMLFYSPLLTGVAFVFIPMLIVIALAFTPILRRHNERYFERTAVEQSRLIESIRDVTAVKSSAAEIPIRWRYEAAIVDAMTSYFRSARTGISMQILSRLVQIASATLILWFGARLVLAGEMSVGQLMAFQALVVMVMAPIMGFIGLWQEFQDALLSLQRLSDIYEADLEQEVGSAPMRIDIHGKIKLDNVSFHYNEGDKNILRNINLDVVPGEKLAIVGRSGCGKSTLAMLIQGFYRPTEGRILIDGNDLNNIDLASYRDQLGVVPQEAAIFNDTIRQNISMHNPDVLIEQVARAATLANAHEFIMGFPLGYDTVIGETGIKLSGGQRQRICIARALINDPRILILDEATSAMDTESERAIQQNLDSILGNRTALIIAHRFNTIRNCDRILVLDEGMVAELGSHDELIAQRGLYYYLHNQQLNL